MLVFPFKITDDVDIYHPFKRYLEKENSQEVEKFEQDIVSLKSLRKEMAQIQLTASEENREKIIRYFIELCKAEGRFPISDSQVKVHFSWADAFKKTRKAAAVNCSFEKAGVLYNWASLEGALGAGFDRSTEEGLKLASRHFQVAAGIYQFIKEQIMPNVKSVVTSDLSNQGLTMAIYVMLAQSQACIVETCIKTRSQRNMKQALIAKLARQASDYFSKAHCASMSSDMAGTLDSSWQRHLDFQAHLYTAKAGFWQAQAAKEQATETATGFGEEIQRLQIVEDSLRNITSNPRDISHLVVSSARELLARTSHLLKKAIEDNRNIYHETIPPASSLVAIGKVSMVKEIAALPEIDFNSASLFEGMLPWQASETVNSYLSELNTLFKDLDTRVQQATKECRERLAEVGLPGSLEAATTDEGVPDSTWTKIEQAQSMGVLSNLQNKAVELDRMSARAKQLLDQIKETSEQEQLADREFRTWCGGYEGTSSEILCRDVDTDHTQFSSFWQQASGSDAILNSRLHDSSFLEVAQLLALKRVELSALVPSGRSDGNQPTAETAELSQLLMKMAQLIQQRNEQLEDLKNMTQAEKDCILKIIGASSGQLGAPVVEQERRKFESPKRDIESLIQAQEVLLKQIMAANQKFKTARETDPALLERENFLQKINVNVGIFQELMAQASEGSLFYNDLLRRLSQLLQRIHDLAYTQQMQRSEFETHLRQMQADEHFAKIFEDEAKISPRPGAYPSSADKSGYGGQMPSASPAYPTAFNPSNDRSGSVTAYSASNPFLPNPVQAVNDPKVTRLCEMGFGVVAVEEALRKHKGDENAAANELLAMI